MKRNLIEFDEENHSHSELYHPKRFHAKPIDLTTTHHEFTITSLLPWKPISPLIIIASAKFYHLYSHIMICLIERYNILFPMHAEKLESTYGDMIIDENSAIYICTEQEMKKYETYIESTLTFHTNTLLIIYGELVTESDTIRERLWDKYNVLCIECADMHTVCDIISIFINQCRIAYDNDTKWYDRKFLTCSIKYPDKCDTNPFRYYQTNTII